MRRFLFIAILLSFKMRYTTHMQKELEDFGLSEKEAKVYLASLALGKATADQLAKQAGIKRPTAYVQIESLSKMGLMSTFEEGKKTFFTPESPEGLKRILSRRKEEVGIREKELSTLLPDLLRVFEGAGERPLVRFFEGIEGITAMREEALTDLKSGEQLYVMYNYDELFKIYPREEVIDFSERREKKGIILKIVYSRKEGKLSTESKGDISYRGYLPFDKFPLSADFFIFKDKVAIMALSGKIFGITIESRVIAQSMLALFSVAWEQSEKE